MLPNSVPASEQMRCKYRERAAERRNLHGGFGVGYGQKNSEGSYIDTHRHPVLAVHKKLHQRPWRCHLDLEVMLENYSKTWVGRREKGLAFRPRACWKHWKCRLGMASSKLIKILLTCQCTIVLLIIL
ncbi:hypothetical protein HN51_020057 [Arachis hypogaea]|uniref:uncharacterized protein n=1 Tax=Arachis hypogaea TaxID=3818 RepID=UPI0034E65645